MTCIVGIAEKGRVWIGADSCASNGNAYTLTRDTGKIFRSGSMLIASSGNLRCSNLLQYSFSPAPFEIGDNPARYLISEFASAVRELFKEHGTLTSDEELTKSGDAASFWMLIGLAGRLFRCSENFQIEEFTDGFDAQGAGCDIARGALCVLSSDLPPDKRILLALEASARFDVSVGPPFIIESI